MSKVDYEYIHNKKCELNNYIRNFLDNKEDSEHICDMIGSALQDTAYYHTSEKLWKKQKKY